MKKLISLLFIILSVTLTVSCNSSKKKSKKIIIVNRRNILKKNINVEGMTCVGCEVTLEQNISKIEGVVSVKASHKNKKAIVEFDSTKTNIYDITMSIIKAGYKPFKK